MKISVIIPTYKPDFTLFECLDSLAKQTLLLELFEVILVLNGDKNPYENEILNYINNSSLHTQYIYTSEKGVSNARNIGIQYATGEYVTFIDSDDWVSENYLNGLLKQTNNNQMALADVLCYDVNKQSFFKDYLGKRYEGLETGKLYPDIKIRSYFSTPWGKLIPTRVAKSSSFSTKYDYGEDGLYMFSIAPSLPLGIKANGDVIYYRRCVADSLSRKKVRKTKVVINQFKLLFDYWVIYLRNPKNYSIAFFILRNFAIMSHIIKK